VAGSKQEAPQSEERAIAWCDKCVDMRDVVGGKVFVAKNGARQRTGKCAACASRLTGQLEGPAGNYG